MPHTVEKTEDNSMSLVHSDHGECFHSNLGARLEAESLYIDRSGFHESLATGRPIAVLDVGLGLGYNAVAGISKWFEAKHPGDLRIVSLEWDQDLVKELASGKARWMGDWSDAWCKVSASLQPADHGFHSELRHANQSSRCFWDVYVGDARKAVQKQQFPFLFDFVWQDPFSPKNNPDLWTSQWFRDVRRLCSSSSTLATYSVARIVREAVADGGWDWSKIDAVGLKKRHWLCAKPAQSC